MVQMKKGMALTKVISKQFRKKVPFVIFMYVIMYYNDNKAKVTPSSEVKEKKT